MSDSIDVRPEFLASLLSQALTATTGAEIEAGWSSGRYTAQWADNTGKVRTCAYRGIRNQSANDITVVVHPIQSYAASTGAEKLCTLKIPALSSCFDLVFDVVVDAGSSTLDADVLFFPVTVRS